VFAKTRELTATFIARRCPRINSDWRRKSTNFAEQAEILTNILLHRHFARILRTRVNLFAAEYIAKRLINVKIIYLVIIINFLKRALFWRNLENLWARFTIQVASFLLASEIVSITIDSLLCFYLVIEKYISDMFL